MALLRITNGLERMTDLELLGKVRYIITAITGNTSFPTPEPTLAALTTQADDFEQAINDALAGGSYDKSVRDNKKLELVDSIHNLSYYVLFTAKGDRLVAESSGLPIAKDPTPTPPLEKASALVLSDAQNAGEMQLLFTKVQGAKSYMYQISLDPADETKWVTTYGTLRKTLFTGLTSGTKYYVRVVALGTNRQVVYSDVVARVVQ